MENWLVNDPLYHYCSTATFHAIVSGRSLRLSSLSLSNDTREGKLVAQTLRRIAERDGLSSATTERLLQMVLLFDEYFDGLGFCLSEERDLLSQWRGYADDGRGVSVGFSRKYLQELAAASVAEDKAGFSLRQVRYEPSEHEAEVRPTYLEVKQLIEQGAFNYRGPQGLLDTRTDEELAEENKRADEAMTELSRTLLALFPKLFLLKSRAFREEKEWRLLSHVVHGVTPDPSYRPAADKLVPCLQVEMSPHSEDPIAEVILGPKHSTPESTVKHFLRTSGFPDVPVLRSEATYR